MGHEAHDGEPRRLLTWDDYAAAPDDGQVRQLIDGELIVTPAPISRHQRIIGWLHVPLFQAIEAPRLGTVLFAPVDVILDEHTVVQPDVLVVSPQRATIVGDRVQGAPDLVIEVLSPSTRRLDVRRKRDLYAKHGVPRYWIADPEADRLELYVLESGAYRLERVAEAPGTLETTVIGVPVSFDLTRAFG